MSQAKAANRGPMDAFLWQKDQSLFFPRAWKTVANYSYEMVSYPPQSIGDFGGTTTFLIPNNVATYLGKVILEFEVLRSSAALAAGDSFDDFLAYAALEQVKITYGQNDVDVLDGEFMKFKFYDERMDEYKRDAIDTNVWGPVAAPGATRAAQVAAKQANLDDLYTNTVNIDQGGGTRAALKCTVELPFWHTRSLQQYMPQVLGSEIFYKIKYRPLSECLRGAAPGTGVAIQNQVLYVEQVYAGPDEQSRLHFNAQKGILQLHDRQQIQTVIDPSGALPNGFGTRIVQVPLTNFNTSTSYILCAIRDAEQLQTPSNVDRWTLRGQGDESTDINGDAVALTGGDPRYILTDIAVKSSNGEIKRKIPRELWKPYMWGHTREGPGHSDRLIAIDFGKHPLTAADAYGSLNLGLITAPILEFTFIEGGGTAVGADATRIVGNAASTIRIDCFGTVKNLNFYKGGNLYTQFQ